MTAALRAIFSLCFAWFLKLPSELRLQQDEHERTNVVHTFYGSSKAQGLQADKLDDVLTICGNRVAHRASQCRHGAEPVRRRKRLLRIIF